MAHRNLFRRRYYLLPKEPFQFGIKKTSNPYLIALHTFLQTFNLKHVNRIEYAFDPFHDNAKVIRYVLMRVVSGFWSDC